MEYLRTKQNIEYTRTQNQNIPGQSKAWNITGHKTVEYTSPQKLTGIKRRKNKYKRTQNIDYLKTDKTDKTDYQRT